MKFIKTNAANIRGFIQKVFPWCATKKETKKKLSMQRPKGFSPKKLSLKKIKVSLLQDCSKLRF